MLQGFVYSWSFLCLAKATKRDSTVGAFDLCLSEQYVLASLKQMQFIFFIFEG